MSCCVLSWHRSREITHFPHPFLRTAIPSRGLPSAVSLVTEFQHTHTGDIFKPQHCGTYQVLLHPEVNPPKLNSHYFLSLKIGWLNDLIWSVSLWSQSKISKSGYKNVFFGKLWGYITMGANYEFITVWSMPPGLFLSSHVRVNIFEGVVKTWTTSASPPSTPIPVTNWDRILSKFTLGNQWFIGLIYRA